ncbi:unnamed protein product [Tuber aestivum]|uniref:Transmembrane protein n=1 Tax=Tuber aestivum TaxID=59557 RepID=A0A292PKX2_9PEZI|nr:unnamed protein product [Tuber aestivum]
MQKIHKSFDIAIPLLLSFLICTTTATDESPTHIANQSISATAAAGNFNASYHHSDDTITPGRAAGIGVGSMVFGMIVGCVIVSCWRSERGNCWRRRRERKNRGEYWDRFGECGGCDGCCGGGGCGGCSC